MADDGEYIYDDNNKGNMKARPYERKTANVE